MADFTVRIGNLGDLDLLVSHRQKMWEAIYPEKSDEIAGIEGLTRRWIKDSIQKGTLVPLIALTNDGIAAGSGCILIREDQPRPGSDQIYNPYLLSVYTEKQYRKQGVASSILDESIEWAKRQGFDRMILHASPEGRPLYEKAGFIATNEMRMWF